MLYTIRDESSIKNILFTRLETTHGCKILSYKIKQIKDCIRVGVCLDVDDLRICVQSFEEFPLVVDKRQILNFCDEVMEGVREARMRTCIMRLKPSDTIEELPGTGMRGNWDPQRHHI